MKTVLGILATAGLASAALASSVSAPVFGSVTFNNKGSVDAAGDVHNFRDSWVSTGSGSVVNIRVTGQLTEIATATFANEAKVRLSAGAGHTFGTFDLTGSSVNGYVGTIPVGPTVLAVTPFTLNNGATIDFEWWESFQDGPADVSEQNWDFVTYEFLGAATVVNGGGALGTLALGSQTVFQSQHVAGGLDFFTFDFAGVSGSNFLNLRTIPSASGGTFDTEMALYDSLGNLVAFDDDGGVGLLSQLSFGGNDQLANPDKTPGFDGLLAAGTYTIVTGGFNTSFGAHISNITPGTASGTYALQVTYAPAPGALGILGLAGLAATRRRRA